MLLKIPENFRGVAGRSFWLYVDFINLYWGCKYLEVGV